MKIQFAQPSALFVSALVIGSICTTSRVTAQVGGADLTPIGDAPQRVAVVPDATETEEVTHVVELPLQGLTLELRKLVNVETGEVIGLARLADGTLVDAESLLAREAALRSASPTAKLHPDLAAALERDPNNAHEVVLWTTYDDDALAAEDARLRAELPSEPSTEDVDRMEESMTTFAMAEVQLALEPVLAELANLGVDVRYVSTTAPAIFVDATQAEVLAIAASRLVDTLYLEKTEADTNTSANGTHRANITYSLGWRGAGARVAVLEDNGVDPACPHLNVSGWYNPFFPNPDDHVHGTSGCIASQLASRRGGAPSVSLFSANASSYSDTNIARAADWIITRNIDVTNMSFGGGYSGALQFKDRYFDYQSRIYSDSYVASAGNSGTFVGSPGTAWNCVTVGSFADNNNSSWTGDVMSSFSDWQNPLTRCEKPNLAAVGETVDTLGMAPDWLRNNYSGTSFSAPFTSAALAVCMALNSNPRVSPEAAMANIMATAWHNIEGATALSSKDGAGGLHQRAAAQCAAANRVRYVTLTPGSFSNNGYYTYAIYLNAGDRTRVTIAWSANANRTYTSTLLNADLDLTVLRGSHVTSGTSFGSSLSFNNNFETVEFTPTTTGWHTVRINDYRFNGTSERVGIAWSQRNLDGGS